MSDTKTWKDNYDTALDAWEKEIRLRQKVEAEIADLRRQLEEAIENGAGARTLLAQWEKRLAMQKEYVALKEHCRVLSNASLNIRHARIERLEGWKGSLLEQRTRLQDEIADLRRRLAEEEQRHQMDIEQGKLFAALLAEKEAQVESCHVELRDQNAWQKIHEAALDSVTTERDSLKQQLEKARNALESALSDFRLIERIEAALAPEPTSEPAK